MRRLALIAIGVALASPPARAQDPPESWGLDVADLPALPEPVYEEQVTSLTVRAATEAEEDIVTGAAKREQSLGSVASAVTVIPGDRLRRFGYRTVAEAVRAAAGMYVVDDRMTERLGIRGLQLLGDFNTRILVLIDGVTVNEPWNQYTGIGRDLPVHLDEVARIEVIRGPVSSVYGTNAFFGIVNIITRGADQQARAYGRVGGGSFGTLTGNAGFAAGDLNRQVRGTVAYWQRGGETVAYPGFVDAGEASPDTDADGVLAYYAGLVAHFDGGFAQVRAYRHERELAGAPYDTLVADPDSRNIDRHVLAEAGYARDLSERVALTGRAYFSRYQFQDYLVYDSEDPANDFRDIGNSQWFGSEVRGRFELIEKGLLGLTAGAEAAFNDTESESFYVGDRPNGARVPQDFDVEGLYGELDTRPSEWFSLSAGLRFDRNGEFGENLSPRGALFVNRGEDYGLKLLYAEGFRYPSAYEAFFADGIDFIANDELVPEKVRSYEVVVWGRPRAGISLRLSGFRWEMRDLIEQEEVDTDDGLRLQFQNIAEMASTGGELEATYRDARGWIGFASATVAMVERDGDADAALNAPQLVAAAGVSTPLIAGYFHLSTDAQLLSSRRTRDPMVEAAAFLGWNAALYAPSYQGFDLVVGVRNLLGGREEVPAQEDYDRTDPNDEENVIPINLIPGAGREFYARLGYSY